MMIILTRVFEFGRSLLGGIFNYSRFYRFITTALMVNVTGRKIIMLLAAMPLAIGILDNLRNVIVDNLITDTFARYILPGKIHI